MSFPPKSTYKWWEWYIRNKPRSTASTLQLRLKLYLVGNSKLSSLHGKYNCGERPSPYTLLGYVLWRCLKWGSNRRDWNIALWKHIAASGRIKNAVKIYSIALQPNAIVWATLHIPTCSSTPSQYARLLLVSLRYHEFDLYRYILSLIDSFAKRVAEPVAKLLGKSGLSKVSPGINTQLWFIYVKCDRWQFL